MDISVALLLANLFSTLFMVGLIWFVQIVHYPMFKDVGNEAFVSYQTLHQKLTTYVVGPPMLVEAFSTVLLVMYPPIGVQMHSLFGGVLLIFVIWFSTAFLQVPCHGKLLDGFEAKYHRRLVNSNWVRTIAWTARGILVCWMVYETIASA